MVKVSPKHYRPAEVDALMGDTTKAQKLLGWKTKTNFADLVSIMMQERSRLVKERCVDSWQFYTPRVLYGR